jgi:hypothetical protein
MRPQPIHDAIHTPDRVAVPSTVRAVRFHRATSAPWLLPVFGVLLVVLALVAAPTPTSETVIGVGAALIAGGPLLALADRLQARLRDPSARSTDDDEH